MASAFRVFPPLPEHTGWDWRISYPVSPVYAIPIAFTAKWRSFSTGSYDTRLALSICSSNRTKQAQIVNKFTLQKVMTIHDRSLFSDLMLPTHCTSAASQQSLRSLRKV